MDTRPPPSSFILVFLAVTMVLAIASGCTIGHLARQNIFIANGLCAGTTAGRIHLLNQKIAEKETELALLLNRRSP